MMKSDMSSYVVAGLVGAATVLLCLTSSEAVRCYNCATAVGYSNDCKPVNNKTDIKECSSSCQIFTAVGGIISRGCSDNTQNTTAKCKSIFNLDLGCTYTCTTDLCNGGVINTLKSASTFAIISAALLAILVTANGQKIVM